MNTANTRNPGNRTLLKVVALAALVALSAASVPDNLTRINTSVAAMTLVSASPVA